MVLVIMVVLAGIAGPRFAAAAANNRARAAADRVASDLELARERARAASVTYTVSFNPTLDRYKLGSGSDDGSIRLDVAPYDCDLLSASFNGSPTVQFNAFGVPDQAGTIQVSGGGVSYTITVAAGTGEVSVH